jgi:hypothetical protein
MAENIPREDYFKPPTPSPSGHAVCPKLWAHHLLLPRLVDRLGAPYYHHIPCPLLPLHQTKSFCVWRVVEWGRTRSAEQTNLNCASRACICLSVLLQEHVADPLPDERASDDRRCAVLHQECLHHTLFAHFHVDWAMQIWDTHVPTKVKIFDWLFVPGHLHTREKLHWKYILDTASCPCCNAPIEYRECLFFACPAAGAVWTAISISTPSTLFDDIWIVSPSRTFLPWFGPPSFLSFSGTRNAMVFIENSATTNATVASITDLTPWVGRFHAHLPHGRCAYLARSIDILYSIMLFNSK